MSSEEVRQFEAEPHFRAAVQLRQWDDTAKDPVAVTPTLNDFRPLLEQCLISS
jgi:predicted HD phosphohydrolase